MPPYKDHGLATALGSAVSAMASRPYTPLLGVSAPIKRVSELISRAGPTSLPVLITGENGTGKEVVARSLHLASERRDAPLVVVDCAAIAPTLMESELFGHIKGAFTGAATTTSGLAQQADGGTLFLDEIGELPAPVQAKLLRLLQDGSFRKVGGTAPLSVNLRIVAATNMDLEPAMEAGAFRVDLFHRLNGLHIHIPPLRDRTADIPLLLEHYLRLFCMEQGRDVGRLSPRATQVLLAQDWPGNVRQLVNCARYLASLTPSSVIRVEDLPPGLRTVTQNKEPPLGRPKVDPTIPYRAAKRAHLAAFDDAYFSALLEAHGGNISQAARAAGIDRRSIQRFMKRRSDGD